MSAKQYGIPTPIQFDRLYAGPLDPHEVFNSYSEALTYAQGNISYPGQTIGVKKSGLKEDVYVINQDKSLSRLMIQREDIRVVLYADKWIGEVPYEQTVSVPYLETTDNCIISLGEAVTDPDVVREIVNAKIGDTVQEEGSIKFIARGDKPTVDIPITITIGSVVSAVEIPNNVNDNTNHTVVIAKKDAWKGVKPPYTQDLYVFGVRPDSNGTIGINPDSSYAQINKIAAAAAGVVRYEQRNNYVTIAAMNSKPTRDLEVLVVWGDEIVVFENSDTLEDFNTSVDLVLKANEWTTQRPYTQELRVEGLSEYHTGAIGLSDNCTPEEAEIGLNAELELIEQGNGYVVVEATNIKPTIDLPVYLTYGSNITIVPSPEYVGEANRHVDTIAYASKWIKSVDGWEQEVDVEGITSNSIGTMGLRNGATDLQGYVAAVSRIKITKVYDNKVLLTATKGRPSVNLPLCFVFGRNINVAKYPGVIGKVALNASYILFDDSSINSGMSSIQQILEYLQKNKIDYSDVVDSVHDGDLPEDYIPENDSIWQYNMPLSARMGRYLYLRKINYDDVVDNLTTDSLMPLSARQGKLLKETVDANYNTLNNKINDNYDEFIDFKEHTENALSIHNNSITNLQSAIGNVVIEVSKTAPVMTNEKYKNKNVVWIKTEGVQSVNYTITFNANGGTGAPASISGTSGIAITMPTTEPTRAGYIFAGWNTLGGSEDIGAGDQYIFNTDSTKITLYAAWTPSLIKVTLDNQSATSSGTSEFYYTYGDDEFYYKNTSSTDDLVVNNIISSLPKKTGYTFAGYYSAINGSGTRYISTTGEIDKSIINYTDNVTLYAYWTSDSYTITYNANGGTGAPASQTAASGDDIILTTDKPTKTDYTFLGWADSATATTPILYPGGLYTDNVSVTLYAVWSAPKETIVLNSESTSTIIYAKNNNIYSDEECTMQITSVAIPTDKEGHTFTGYYSGTDGTGIQYILSDGTFNSNIYTLGSVNIYAGWSKNTYTIVFNDNGGENGPGTITAQYGDSITIPSDIPTYDEGYKFIGWGEGIELDDNITIFKPGNVYIVENNVEFFAVFENIFKVTLDDEDATTSGTSEFYYVFDYEDFYSDEECNTLIGDIVLPMKTGYTFAGYYSEPDDNGNTTEYITDTGEIVNSLEKVVGHSTLHAKWK